MTKVTRTNPGGTAAITRFAYTSDTQTLVADPNTDQAVAVVDVPHTTYTLNSAERVSKVKDQLGRERGASYTPNHDVSMSTSGSGAETSFGYSANGGESLTDVNSPTGASSSAAYGNTGASKYSPSGSTDGQGNDSTSTYDGPGNQTSQKNAGTTAQADVEYYDDGVPKSSTSPGREKVDYTRDADTHQITKVDPPGDEFGATNLTWDEFGRLSTSTDGRGKVTTFSYDKGDRVTKVDYSDTTPDVTYTYDNGGNIATRDDATGTTTYGYDGLERMTTRTAPGTGGGVSYEYDPVGNLTKTTDADGTSTHGYDAANQATDQTTSAGAKVAYKYDDNGNRTDTWFDTNTDNTTFAAHTRNEYDKDDRNTRTWTSRNNNNDTRVSDISYCYSPYQEGQDCPGAKASTDTSLIQYSVDHLTGDRSEYSYDAQNRLTKATNFDGHDYDYEYDLDSNLKTIKVDGTTTKNLNFNAVNQITNDGYSYDASGNRITSGGVGTLSYDGANRMTGKTDAYDGDSVYTYAGTDQGELTKRDLEGGSTFAYTYGRTDSNNQPLVETFTKDGSRYGLDYDPNGTPISMRMPGGEEHYFALDRQATAVALVSQNGVKSGGYTYTPYGDVADVTGVGDPVDINFYRHTLGFTDTGNGTGFTKHGIRWNDTVTATWTTQDPLNAALDLGNGNRYAYAGGDPINNVDPTGQAIMDFLGPVGDIAQASVNWQQGNYYGVAGNLVGSGFGTAFAGGCLAGMGLTGFGVPVCGAGSAGVSYLTGTFTEQGLHYADRQTDWW